MALAVGDDRQAQPGEVDRVQLQHARRLALLLGGAGVDGDADVYAEASPRPRLPQD